MNEAAKADRSRLALRLGAIVLAALHGLGVYAYVTRNVLKHVWLWDNPDYMLYLYAAYFHLHMIALAGHLYVWGPYLILRRYRARWWSLYYVSFASAYVFTVIPLLSVQRVAALYGALVYRVIAVYALLLLLYVARDRVASRARATTAAPTRDQLRFRSTDGSWNNLEHPEIGRAGTPLGRYLPAVAATPQDVYREPSVLEVSERLLKQKQFIPAATSNGTINALAFAWVNFFVHDFYARGTEFSRAATAQYKLPVGDGTFVYMSKLPEYPEGKAGSHRSGATHWFDGSQVYGSDEAWAQQLRTRTDSGTPGAKLRVCDDGLLPKYRPGQRPGAGAGGPLDLFCGAEGRGGSRGGPAVFLTGDSPRSSLHIGLLLFHHLWAHEHNYIVDQLAARYPAMTNEELYRTARLIVAAEIVKVHTVEWTAQMTSDPVSAEFVRRIWDTRVGDPKSYRPDRAFAVSEEFLASYVLHEIVPPEFSIVH